MDVKLMVCLICDTFDNFDTVLAEVHYELKARVIKYLQSFFDGCSYDELKMQSFDVDLTSDEIKELKPLLPHTTDDEIQSMILFMVKQLKVTMATRSASPTAPLQRNLLITDRSDMEEDMRDFAHSAVQKAIAHYGLETPQCIGQYIGPAMTEVYG